MDRLPGTSTRRSLCIALLTLFLFMATACGAEQAANIETLSDGTLAAGAAVPVPSGKSVITIDRGLRSTAEGAELRLDMHTIERLGLIRYSVADPWLKREVAYTGVLLSDLVKLVAPARGAKTMNLVALDDYEVQIALADIERWPIMLATRLDGSRMAVAKGGPTRIVFPYDLVDGIDELEYKERWIWNIDRITFQ